LSSLIIHLCRDLVSAQVGEWGWLAHRAPQKCTNAGLLPLCTLCTLPRSGHFSPPAPRGLRRRPPGSTFNPMVDGSSPSRLIREAPLLRGFFIARTSPGAQFWLTAGRMYTKCKRRPRKMVKIQAKLRKAVPVPTLHFSDSSGTYLTLFGQFRYLPYTSWTGPVPALQFCKHRTRSTRPTAHALCDASVTHRALVAESLGVGLTGCWGQVSAGCARSGR
jgi:hypothetical protein